ncbi:hypothetical protein [Cribrihabitans neustonicus]
MSPDPSARGVLCEYGLRAKAEYYPVVTEIENAHGTLALGLARHPAGLGR